MRAHKYKSFATAMQLLLILLILIIIIIIALQSLRVLALYSFVKNSFIIDTLFMCVALLLILLYV